MKPQVAIFVAYVRLPRAALSHPVCPIPGSPPAVHNRLFDHFPDFFVRGPVSEVPCSAATRFIVSTPCIFSSPDCINRSASSQAPFRRPFAGPSAGPSASTHAPLTRAPSPAAHPRALAARTQVPLAYPRAFPSSSGIDRRAQYANAAAPRAAPTTPTSEIDAWVTTRPPSQLPHPIPRLKMPE